MDSTALGLISALLGFVTIASCVSLWLHFRPSSAHQMTQRLSGVELELRDLHDKVIQWTKRDNVRRSREKARPLPDPLDIIDPPDEMITLPNGGLLRAPAGAKPRMIGGR